MNVTIELPQDLYDQAQQIAESQKVRVDDVLAAAFSDHLSQLRELQERAKRGDKNKFLDVLSRVPDVEPDEYDRL